MPLPASGKKITVSELSLLLCCSSASGKHSLRLPLPRPDHYRTGLGNFSPFPFTLFCRPSAAFLWRKRQKVLSADRDLFPFSPFERLIIFFYNHICALPEGSASQTTERLYLFFRNLVDFYKTERKKICSLVSKNILSVTRKKTDQNLYQLYFGL